MPWAFHLSNCDCTLVVYCTAPLVTRMHNGFIVANPEHADIQDRGFYSE